jgi:hypothetical protein
MSSRNKSFLVVIIRSNIRHEVIISSVSVARSMTIRSRFLDTCKIH